MGARPATRRNASSAMSAAADGTGGTIRTPDANPQCRPHPCTGAVRDVRAATPYDAEPGLRLRAAARGVAPGRLFSAPGRIPSIAMCGTAASASSPRSSIPPGCPRVTLRNVRSAIAAAVVRSTSTTELRQRSEAASDRLCNFCHTAAEIARHCRKWLFSGQEGRTLHKIQRRSALLREAKYVM